jgi:hypothetical protein
MKLDGWLQCSRGPTTAPYPEQSQSIPHTKICLFKNHFNTALPSIPRSLKWSLSFMIRCLKYQRTRTLVINVELYSPVKNTLLPKYLSPSPRVSDISTVCDVISSALMTISFQLVEGEVKQKEEWGKEGVKTNPCKFTPMQLLIAGSTQPATLTRWLDLIPRTI